MARFFKSHGNSRSFKEAVLCIPPSFIQSLRMLRKHQRRNFLSLSLSLAVGSLAISLSAYSCIHMHRSSPPVVDAHRVPSNVLATCPSAYLDYKPLILPFLFLPLAFSLAISPFISTLIRCAPSRCTLESVRFFLPLFRQLLFLFFAPSKLFDASRSIR